MTEYFPVGPDQVPDSRVSTIIHIDTQHLINYRAGKYMGLIKNNLLVNLLPTIEHNLNKEMLLCLLPKVIK